MEYGHEACETNAALICLYVTTRLSPRHFHL